MITLVCSELLTHCETVVLQHMVIYHVYVIHCHMSVWRACCYFIILSVIFPDGNWSLLVAPSDLLAR